MPKRVLVLLALLMSSGLVASAQQYPVTVVDDRGLEVTIESQPNRIVVAGIPLYTEILIDLGAIDRLIAVAQSPDNPPEVADLPRVGESFSPSVEVILALEPDLVLGAWGAVRDQLEELGIVVLTTGRSGAIIASVSDIFTTIRTVGIAVGNSARAADLIGQIAEQIIIIESAVLGREPVQVAFLYMSVPDTAPYAIGSGSIENELILRAGGTNVFADIFGFPPVSLEEVLARDPEVIFTDPDHVENVLESQLLRDVTAVRDGQVFGIKASYSTSTKVAEVLRVMSEFLHPEE